MLPNFLVALAHIPEPEIRLSPAPALSLPCICLNPNARAPSGCLSPSLGSGYVFLQLYCLDGPVQAYKPTHMDQEEHLPARIYLQYPGSLDASAVSLFPSSGHCPLQDGLTLFTPGTELEPSLLQMHDTCGSDQIPLPSTPA